MHDYSILYKDFEDEAACVLDRPPLSGPIAFRPALGKPVADSYGEPLEIHMAPDMGGIQPRDLVRNTYGFYMVSQRLMDLLQMHSGAEFEFLPFWIMNHKGKKEEGDFYIANLLGRQVDCADMSRSIMKESHMRKGRYRTISKLVLDHDKIDPDYKIFRLAQMPKLFIIRDDLRQILEDHDVKGCSYLPMGEPVDIY